MLIWIIPVNFRIVWICVFISAVVICFLSLDFGTTITADFERI